VAADQDRRRPDRTTHSIFRDATSPWVQAVLWGMGKNPMGRGARQLELVHGLQRPTSKSARQHEVTAAIALGMGAMFSGVKVQKPAGGCPGH
jgi:hypothetical protein